MRTSSAGSRSKAGVTLIEMMVVVTIIGLILAIVAPSMGAGLDSIRMASSADNVASFLNAAANRSERRQQPVEVLVSIKENRLLLYTNEPGFTRELKMPDGIRIEAVVPRDQNGPIEPFRVMFLPGASVPAIGVQLINSHGNRRVVRLDPTTGFPRIETPKEEQ